MKVKMTINVCVHQCFDLKPWIDKKNPTNMNTTGDKSSLAYLMQKFPFRGGGNAASILGTLPPTLSPPLNDAI